MSLSRLEDIVQRPLARAPSPSTAAAPVLALADFMVGRVFEFRQATPFLLDVTQRNFGALRPGYVAALSDVTMNYGVRWEPWFPQQHQNNAVYNFSVERLLAGQRSEVYPQAPPGFHYPGDDGFPGKAGHEPDWLNIQPRVGVSWDPFGEGRTVVRAGYGLNGDFIAGRVHFDALPGAAVRTGGASDQAAVVVSTIRGAARPDQPLPGHH